MEMLKVEIEERKRGDFVSVVAVTASQLLQEVGKEQVPEIPRVTTTVFTYAASDTPARERSFQPFQ